jgi:hypothetical protein
MSASDWLKGTLQNEGQKTGISPKSGDKLEWGQKVGMADSLAPQGFQGATHTNHTVHTEKQPPRKRGKNTLPAAKGLTKISDITAGIVSALATGQALPVPTLPDNLMQRVNLICQTEDWSDADRVEWIEILSRKIRCSQQAELVISLELVAMLDTHLDRWHRNTSDDREARAMQAKAQRQACMENHCTGCLFWDGAQSIATGRYNAFTAAGVEAKPRTRTVGKCLRHSKPWRISNIASDPDYQRWHFIGQCGRKAA